VFGTISLYPHKFVYKITKETFNSESYIDYLDNSLLKQMYKKNNRIFLIQDNASYHKKKEVFEWLSKSRKYIEVFFLPPYSPELNASERIWNFTRKNYTHNRFFASEHEHKITLENAFNELQNNVLKIESLTKSFL